MAADREELVRQLIICIMDAAIYSPAHRKVHEAADRMAGLLTHLPDGTERLTILVRDGQIVFGGRPLYEISLYARRLIKIFQDRGIGGLSFLPGMQGEEFHKFLEVVVPRGEGKATFQALRDRLRNEGVVHVELEDLRAGEGGEGPKKATSLLMSRRLYESAVSIIKDILNDVKLGRRIDLKRVNDVIEGITNLILEDKKAMISTLQSLKDYDEYTFQHSVNVCVLSIALAETVVSHRAVLIDLGRAALLHDIGKILIPIEILNHPGHLVGKDWETMKSHPFLGARVLLETEGTGPLGVLVAFGHHQRFDRSGYPALLRPIPANPFTQIVSIADVYDSLTSSRSYKRGAETFDVMTYMLERAGRDFDPALLRQFAQMMGIYPAGTFVLLDSGEVAVVARMNPGNLVRPRVQIVVDGAGRRLAAPQPFDLLEKNPETGEYAKSIVNILPASLLQKYYPVGAPPPAEAVPAPEGAGAPP